MERVIAIRGNHESMFLKWLNDKKEKLTRSNGERNTSYHARNVLDISVQYFKGKCKKTQPSAANINTSVMSNDQFDDNGLCYNSRREISFTYYLFQYSY